LHAICDRPVIVSAIDQQVDMIRCDDVVQYTQAVTTSRFVQPSPPDITITRRFQQEFTVMTPLRNVPDVTWQKVAIRSWHGVPSLEPTIGHPCDRVSDVLRLRGGFSLRPRSKGIWVENRTIVPFLLSLRF
jgi:hypothetical protein